MKVIHEHSGYVMDPHTAVATTHILNLEKNDPTKYYFSLLLSIEIFCILI